MSDSIYKIIERLALIEGKTTPTTVKHGLNQQQKGVPQLPSLFKPKKITALGAPTDPKHPAAGYMVGGESAEPKRPSLGEAMQAVEEEMLSKVKNDLKSYLAQLDDRYADDGQRERSTPELDKLTKKEKIDRDLVRKAVDAVEKAEEQVEEGDDYGTAGTAPMDSEAGHALGLKAQQVLDQPIAPVGPTESVSEDSAVFEIHGNDSCGYEIRRGNRALPTRFPRRDHAEMAIQLFKNRHKPVMPTEPVEQDLSQDYIEER